MEPIKSILTTQALIVCLFAIVRLGSFCIANQVSAEPGFSWSLPTRKQIDVMQHVKKYKIFYKNGKRRVSIKYK